MCRGSSRPTWPKVAQGGPNCPGWLKWPKVAQMAQSSRNGPKWLKLQVLDLYAGKFRNKLFLERPVVGVWVSMVVYMERSMVVYELHSRSVPHNGSTVGVWVSRQTSDVSRQVGHLRWDRRDTQKDIKKRKKAKRQVGHPRWDRGGIGGHLSPGNKDDDKDIDICTDSGGNCH